MKAAVVMQAGQMPVYSDVDEPAPAEGHAIIDVEASALSHITRGRASGTHYSSSARLPFIAGIDGVGPPPQDGKRVYFFAPKEPSGGLAAANRRRAKPVHRDPRDARSRHRRGDGDSRHVVVGSAHRTRALRSRRDRVDQRCDGRVGTARCADRQTSRGREGDRNRAASADAQHTCIRGRGLRAFARSGRVAHCSARSSLTFMTAWTWCSITSWGASALTLLTGAARSLPAVIRCASCRSARLAAQPSRCRARRCGHRRLR